jgi:hypothetical protein
VRGRFDEAHRALDEIEPSLAKAGAKPRVRYLLERGRIFNSSGNAERARPLFLLAVDAAHVVAVTYRETDAAADWNREGVALACVSEDAKARALEPATLNNRARDLHDMGALRVARCMRSLGRFPEALSMQPALESDDAERNMVDGYVLEEIAELYDALGREGRARPFCARRKRPVGRCRLRSGNPDRLPRLRAKAR